MFGHDLPWWNAVMLSFLGIGAIAAIIVVVATAIIIKLQDQEAADAKDALEKYKITAKMDSDIAIAKARADAEVAINAVREEASTQNKILEKATADATAHAADANKAAADANDRAAKIMKDVAWRMLSPADANTLRATLESDIGDVNIRYTDGDPEALFFALQLSNIFSAAHWQVGFGGIKLQNAIAFGLFIPGPVTAQVTRLRKAFNDANILFDPEDLPPIGMGTVVSTVPDGAILMVGSKEPDVLR